MFLHDHMCIRALKPVDFVGVSVRVCMHTAAHVWWMCWGTPKWVGKEGERVLLMLLNICGDLQAFPHPLARLENKEVKGRTMGLRNQISYLVVEELIWRGLEPAINRFREQVLGLEPLRMGNKRPHLLSAYQVSLQREDVALPGPNYMSKGLATSWKWSCHRKGSRRLC